MDLQGVKALNMEDRNNNVSNVYKHYLTRCSGAVITKIQINCKALCSCRAFHVVPVVKTHLPMQEI